MGRSVNDARITTRAARSKLDPSKTPYWRAADVGHHLGYRKGIQGGSWLGRFRRRDRTYAIKVLAKADDLLSADGVLVLDYSQALKAARAWWSAMAERETGREWIDDASYTVGQVLDDYLGWYADHRKSIYEVRRRIEIDIRPALGRLALAELNSRDIQRWHEGLARLPRRVRGRKGQPPRKLAPSTEPDQIRRRKVSANKALIILKAALNRAYRQGRASTDHAWRRVGGYRNVDTARTRYLTTHEAVQLIEACEPDFRQLVEAGLYTGCRYGELIRLEVGDLNEVGRTIHVRFTKTDRPRQVALTDQGFDHFRRMAAGRLKDGLMFIRSDGKPWGKSHQGRRLVEACRQARLDPPISFHILRHTYGSWLAMSGVPLQVIAEALGHADTRITHRHYAALAPSYVADTIRANLPTLGLDAITISPLDRGRTG